MTMTACPRLESRLMRSRTISVWVTPSAAVGERLLRRELHVHLVEQAAPQHLMAKQHVLHDIQVVAQRKVLVDGRDAQARRVPGAVQMDRVAVPENLAAGRLPDSRDGLDQR